MDEHLVPLAALSAADLRVIAAATLELGQQQQLSALLERNRLGSFSPEEQSDLDALLVEVDRVALLKAKARYTMGLFGVDTDMER